jgi:hypothetical protein
MPVTQYRSEKVLIASAPQEFGAAVEPIVIFGEEKIRSVIGNLAENPSPVIQFDAIHGVG